MFNSGLKKEWLLKLEETQNEYIDEMNSTQGTIIELFESRENAVLQIKLVEKFINSIANTPKDYSIKLEKINLAISEFTCIIELKSESEIAAKISGGIASGGALAGTGVAVLGPTAAMAIATTFGTASTGTAISALSGAAATNAALAWLGGGALAAGGGGISAGSTFLALAGPIGWTIGGLALIGGALFASAKNKKIAKEAEKNVYKLKEEVANILKTKAEIISTLRLTSEHVLNLASQLNIISDMRKKAKRKISIAKKISNFIKKLFGKSMDIVVVNDITKNYSYFSKKLKYELGILVNNTLSLSKLVEKKIG